MKERSVRAIAEYLSYRPIGRIEQVRTLAPNDFAISIEDIRDGRAHVFFSPEDLEHWLDSFKAGKCLLPRTGYCDCCSQLHSDHDEEGELFEVCIVCQAELATFE